MLIKINLQYCNCAVYSLLKGWTQYNNGFYCCVLSEQIIYAPEPVEAETRMNECLFIPYQNKLKLYQGCEKS